MLCRLGALICARRDCNLSQTLPAWRWEWRRQSWPACCAQLAGLIIQFAACLTVFVAFCRRLIQQHACIFYRLISLSCMMMYSKSTSQQLLALLQVICRLGSIGVPEADCTIDEHATGCARDQRHLTLKVSSTLGKMPAGKAPASELVHAHFVNPNFIGYSAFALPSHSCHCSCSWTMRPPYTCQIGAWTC